MAKTNKAAAIQNTLQADLGWRHETTPETAPSFVSAIDLATCGWPRGRISEVVGAASSGRTTLLHSLLATMTTRGEICAVVDAMDGFDPATAELNGVNLSRLTWIRCGGNLEHAMHAADLLLHSGGLGVVAIDFCGAPTQHLQRVPASYWFRFRRAVETSQTICLVLAEQPVTKSCSTLIVETASREAHFTPRLFRELVCRVGLRKPYAAASSELRAAWQQTG